MSRFHEVVAHVNVREGPLLSLDAVVIVVVLVDRARRLPVLDRTFLDYLLRLCVETSHEYVNDDVFLAVDELETLVHSRGQVDVPSSATVHKEVRAGVLRLKNHRN